MLKNPSRSSKTATAPPSTSPSTGLRPIRVRIVMVGAEKTGKSCLIKRYCEKRFVTKYMATIGIDYGATKIYVDKESS
jgi:GTPase SAR1 family protein